MCSIDFNKIEKGAFVKESIDILHQAYMSKNWSCLSGRE